MGYESNQIVDRLERAKAESMQTQLVSDDPCVLQVTNEDSDRVHTVVPESAHCSCEDHTYRGLVCKHMLVILLGEHSGPMAEGLDQVADTKSQRLSDLYDESETVAEEISDIDTALALTDSDTTGWEDAEPVTIESPDERPYKDEFDSMVAKLTDN